MSIKLSTFFNMIKRYEDISDENVPAEPAKSKDENELRKQLKDIASTLVNIIVMGREKRNSCLHYEVGTGLCKYIRIDVYVPTLTTIRDEDGFKVVVSAHPEICAVCPFWRSAS